MQGILLKSVALLYLDPGAREGRPAIYEVASGQKQIIFIPERNVIQINSRHPVSGEQQMKIYMLSSFLGVEMVPMPPQPQLKTVLPNQPEVFDVVSREPVSKEIYPDSTDGSPGPGIIGVAS